MPVTVRYVGLPIGPRLRMLPEIVATLRTKYLTMWATQIVISERRNIDESRAPDGSLYLALKRPRGKGHNPDNKPLYDSGKLYDLITYWPLNPTDSVTIGSLALSKKGFPYPNVQNAGYPRGAGIDGRIPRRRFYGLRDSDQLMLSTGADEMAREIIETMARG